MWLRMEDASISHDVIEGINKWKSIFGASGDERMKFFARRLFDLRGKIDQVGA